MKKLRSLAISLVVLVTMLMSFQGFSQSAPLAFDTIVQYTSNKVDLGDHVFMVSDLNINDTLFFIELDNSSMGLYRYYGIIDTMTNDNVSLDLYCVTNKDYTNFTLDLNGTNIRGTNGQYIYPWLFHLYKMTIPTNTKFDFDVLTIITTKFKFSFTFTTNNVGFEDNFFTDSKTEFKVYPNPCENTLNIEADGLKRVFDINGRKILESYDNTIDISNLAPGMYVVMLENGAREKVWKF